MFKCKVYLNRIESIKDFIDITSKFEEDIDIISGRYIINAKSIMGVLSLDLDKSLNVCIHTEDENVINDFKKEMCKFNTELGM